MKKTLVMICVFIFAYAFCAYAGTPGWYRTDDGNWRMRDLKGKDVANAWIIDDIPENQSVYYIDAEGKICNAAVAINDDDIYYTFNSNGALTYQGPFTNDIRIIEKRYGATTINTHDSKLIHTSEIYQKESSMSNIPQQILNLINQVRAKQNLNSLTMTQELQKCSDIRAQEASQFFSHQRPDTRSWDTIFTDNDIDAYYFGENLAFGYLSPESVMQGWTDSPSHYENIIAPYYKHIGISIYEHNGTIFYACEFAN